MKLSQLVKTAIDETRMQMLGAQVLFGFQLQGVFQDGFSHNSYSVFVIDMIALALMVVTIGFLIAVPSQHRIVENGNDSVRIFRSATLFANLALAPFAVAMGCDIYVVGARDWGASLAAAASVATAAIALAAWYGVGVVINRKVQPSAPDVKEMETDLHSKIEQMLTEARVILPGAQALLGFQFVITMTSVFEKLPPADRFVHFIALAAVLFSVILLITPASVHRLGFRGGDDRRFHRIGSILVTVALVPLSAGITGDFYVAVAKMLGRPILAEVSASIAFLFLAFLWFGLPFLIRASVRGAR